jgi:protein TonB
MTRISRILLALCIAALAGARWGTALAAEEPANAGKTTARQAADEAVNAGRGAVKQTAEEGTLQIELVDEMPKVVKQVAPKYPESARKRGKQGTVYVRALVKKDGTTAQVQIPPGKGLAPDLDKAAVEAIRQWTFVPAMKNGKPVAVYVVVPVKFTLAKK